MSELWIDVGADEDVREGTIQLVSLEGVAVVLAPAADGLHALSAQCTHEQGDVADGDPDDTSIACPLHFSRFALTDGTPLDPPADEPLAVHPVLIRDGRILIRTTPK